MPKCFGISLRRALLLTGCLSTGLWAAGLGADANGTAFDAAPFATGLSSPDGKSLGLRWDEPRKIRRLVVVFPAGSAPPDAGALRIEYWHHNWDGKADPARDELDAGRTGWTHIDDWTNGGWRRAQLRTSIQGRRMFCEFPATSAGEGFERPETPGVSYRKTLKIRVISDAALPKIERLEAYTESTLQPLSVRIRLGQPAESSIRPADDEQPRLEAHNGRIVNLRTMDEAGERVLVADVAMAADPIDSRYDRTIVTLRSPVRSFSFAADEVARGDRIFVDDLGALVTGAEDRMSLEQCRALHAQLPGKTVYDRIFDESEQTLGRAWNDMPLKHQILFVHGLPGNRDVMGQTAEGDVTVSGNGRWFKVNPSPRDSARQKWDGQMLQFGFGLPEQAKRAGRELKDGYLPLVRSCWQDGPISYEQLTILDTLDGRLDDIPLDAPTVLLMRIRVVNTSDFASGRARLRLTARVDRPDRGENLVLEGNRVVHVTDKGEKRFRYLFDSQWKGSIDSDGNSFGWSLDLKPGESHNLFCAIPSITLETDEEIDPLARRSFDADAERICRFWREATDRGMRITTPEPWINDFHKSHLRHLLVNCQKELGSDRLHAHVGTFYYGMYPNESAMMVSDLDRRGYHDEARRNIDSMLHYQGTVAFPGNYTGKEGMLYGDGGHETGGYNKSHGYVLWLIAHHWRMTRDRAWLERSADRIVKACDWIARERKATMTPGGYFAPKDGGGAASADTGAMPQSDQRPIEYGWLPPGGLEDVQDFWFWQATNSATDWGFQAVVAALADIGHPRAKELQEEAAAYHQDVMAGMTEARVRTPVVRLRDGRYVPKFPSELRTRGRAYGWLRETLEGSLFLPAYQVLDPDAPETRWIMQDYEDNLYISREYGYDIPNFDQFWFSRGGFSMQACLLDGPLPYLWRDEVKHFLRAYFNSFASGFFPETRMLCEHALPELGYWRGDHFKSSDEAQSTYWLRLMFIREQGDDLYLGQAIPRYWLTDGKGASIERAPSDFGPLSLTYEPNIAGGQIKAVLTPPTRNASKTIYLRFRHPKGKKIASVTVNGKDHTQFDAAKEWVILPGSLDGPQEVIAKY